MNPTRVTSTYTHMAGHLLRCRRVCGRRHHRLVSVVILWPRVAHVDDHRHATVHLRIRNVRVQTHRRAPCRHTPGRRLAHHHHRRRLRRIPVHQSHLVLVATLTAVVAVVILLLMSPSSRHRCHFRNERMHLGRPRIHIARQTAALTLSRRHEPTAASATVATVSSVVAVMPCVVVLVLVSLVLLCRLLVVVVPHSSSCTTATTTRAAVMIVRLTVPAVGVAAAVSARNVMTSRIRGAAARRRILARLTVDRLENVLQRSTAGRRERNIHETRLQGLFLGFGPLQQLLNDRTRHAREGETREWIELEPEKHKQGGTSLLVGKGKPILWLPLGTGCYTN